MSISKLRGTHQNPVYTHYKLLTLSVLVAGWLAACTSQPPAPQPPVTQVPPTVIITPPAPVIKPTPPTTQRYTSFADWKSNFILRATAQGYNRADLERLLNSADYRESVVRLDKSQAEFVKMPWEYIDGAVSSSRVSGGKRNYAEQSALLLRNETQYGVPASIVTAIWGMESSYGAATGSSSLTSSLSTLAYEGRRRAFAEQQLLALLQLIERGDINWSQLTGSWAGGMGHTQFIPQTWLTQGVDGNGDGHKNPWQSADALSSTASYLASAGWQRGLPTFYEAKLPTGFDYRQVGSKKTLAEWQSQGVRLMNVVGSAANDTPTELWLPAGKNGPTLLLTRNFDAIKVYNNSSNYALGVSLLARAIVNQPGLQQDFPRDEKPLYTYQVTQLQQRLTSMGYDTKGSDGVIGTNTKLAFQRWQAEHGQTPDGFISQRTAASLLY